MPKSAPAPARFHIGQPVRISGHHGVEIRAVIERINQKTISVVDANGQGYRASPSLLRPLDIEPAPMPKALEGMSLGSVRSHGTGMEGPRWSRTFQLANGAAGTIHEDGEGGELRIEGARSDLVAAVNSALTDAFGEGVICYSGLDMTLLWVDSQRVLGVTFRKALEGFVHTAKALKEREAREQTEEAAFRASFTTKRVVTLGAVDVEILLPPRRGHAGQPDAILRIGDRELALDMHDVSGAEKLLAAITGERIDLRVH